MVNFFLSCVKCGRCYDLTEEARQLFLRAKIGTLVKFDKVMECCDSPCYAVTIPFRTIGDIEMKKILAEVRKIKKVKK